MNKMKLIGILFSFFALPLYGCFQFFEHIFLYSPKMFFSNREAQTGFFISIGHDMWWKTKFLCIQINQKEILYNSSCSVNQMENMELLRMAAFFTFPKSFCFMSTAIHIERNEINHQLLIDINRDNRKKHSLDAIHGTRILGGPVGLQSNVNYITTDEFLIRSDVLAVYDGRSM